MPTFAHMQLRLVSHKLWQPLTISSRQRKIVVHFRIIITCDLMVTPRPLFPAPLWATWSGGERQSRKSGKLSPYNTIPCNVELANMWLVSEGMTSHDVDVLLIGLWFFLSNMNQKSAIITFSRKEKDIVVWGTDRSLLSPVWSKWNISFTPGWGSPSLGQIALLSVGISVV